jgi:hypothetical protein
VGVKLLIRWGKWRSMGDKDSLSGTFKLPPQENLF